MSDHGTVDIDRHVRVYLTVFFSLLALTVITVVAWKIHLPHVVAITVALLIATIKGSLVACYFMHLISERKLIYTVLIITVLFFAALLALPVLTSVADRVGA